MSIFLLLLFDCRRHCLGGVDGCLGGVYGAHNVGSGGGIQSEGPGDSGHLSRGKHEAQPQQGVFPEHHQSRHKDRGLQKGRQAKPDDLLHPLDKAVHIPPGDAEHIEAPHGNLDEQDAAPLQIGEKHLDHSVGHHNDAEDQHNGAGEDAESEAGRTRHVRKALHAGQFLDDPLSHGANAGPGSGQANGEGPLQGHRQGVEPDGDCREQADGQKSLYGVQRRLLEVAPVRGVFNAELEAGDHQADAEQCPAQLGEE